jgi:transposase
MPIVHIKPPAYNETEFIAAFEEGLSITALSAQFHLSRNTVYNHIEKLGLQRNIKALKKAKKQKPRKEDKPIITSVIPTLNKSPEPWEPIPNRLKKSVFIVPTLGEIRKKEQAEMIKLVEKGYKVSRKKLN